MKNKKLYAGALTLAISLSTIIPGERLDLSTTAYATEINNNESESEIENSQAMADTTALAEKTSDEKKKDLKNLIDEKDAVHNSSRYVNASKAEQATYDQAISQAESFYKSDNLANIDKLITDINDAKLNLGANLRATASNRDALTVNIAIAYKLSQSSKVYGDNYHKLQKAIDTAKQALVNTEALEDDIIKENEKLAKLIDDIIKATNTNPDDIGLTDKELNELGTDDKLAYAKSLDNLYKLHNQAYQFVESDTFKNFTNQALKDSLVKELNNSAEIYNNTNSEKDKIDGAYNSLSLAYNQVLTAIDESNSQVNRLKKDLEKLINDYDAFKNDNKYLAANKASVATYNTAISHGNSVYNSDNPSIAQLEEAIRKISIAKLAVVPAKTVTIDKPNQPTNPSTDDKDKITSEQLKKLVDESENIKKEDKYTKASAENKKKYDDAINNAKEILKDNNPTADQLKEAYSKVIEAKDNLKAENTLPDDVKAELETLETFVNNKDLVKDDSSYKNANEDKKKAYDQAITKAQELITASKDQSKTPSLEEAKSIVFEILRALEDLGYNKATYPDNLQEIIDEAEKFKQHPSYRLKSLSTDEADKKLVSNYNQLIDQAKQLMSTSNPTEASKKAFINRINDVKKAIVGEISVAELNLRALIANDNQFTNSSEYLTAANGNDKDLKQLSEDYKKYIEEAKSLVDSSDKTEVKIKELLNKLETTINTITKETVKPNTIEGIKALLKDAEKAKNHKDYSKVAQQRRENLEKAIEEAQKILEKANHSEKEIKDAYSALDAALRPDDIQKLINPNKEKDLADLSLEELIDLAKKVLDHPDYKDVGASQGKSLTDAIIASENAKNGDDDKAKKEAKENLLGALRQNEISPIVKKILANTPSVSGESKAKEDLRKLIALAEKVMAHKDYEKLDKDAKDNLTRALNEAKEAIKTDNEKDITVKGVALERVLKDKAFKDIIKEINKTGNLATPKEIIEKIANEDNNFRKSDKYSKAQKSLREAYDKALEDAKKVLADPNAKEDDLKRASEALVKAVNNLDGDKYQEKLKALKAKYEKNKKSISRENQNTIEEYFKKLEENKDATMDDLILAEKTLDQAIPKVTGTSTPVTTTRTTTTTVPTTTTTTTPVTTTSKVPATVSPGSVVRTGINSVAKVAVVLLVALGVYTGLSKKDGKNKKQGENNEIK